MPGVSPIRTTFFTLWCWVSWLLNGLAWRMTWSCHSQVRHRLGRGSDAVRMAGSSTDTLSPTEVGALSVAVHPAIASCLSLCLASAGGQAWSLQLKRDHCRPSSPSCRDHVSPSADFLGPAQMLASLPAQGIIPFTHPPHICVFTDPS